MCVAHLVLLTPVVDVLLFLCVVLMCVVDVCCSRVLLICVVDVLLLMCVVHVCCSCVLFMCVLHVCC